MCATSLTVVGSGLYKPRTGRTGHTGRCMNHAPAILAAPALIYSTNRLLVVCIVVHFHLCSLLDRYTALVEQFDGRCVFAVAADGDAACFSLAFWTI